MGIPKFFRFMSERYPLISQLVEENKIPEFDNLYLDMNGIIHNCSHPNDGDAHFRMSEADMFLAIFSYIEHIFAKIKPQKVFFLAIDGVAPRAKMNQQRSRRFRTAQEAKELRDKALRRGEELPEEEAFDSNCITPGTPFMARLSKQLKYFLAKKVTEDAMWQGVEIVLSGHDVPGEGEHKIMEYIRLAKAQPDYNNNVRHCLYGLDADLIMLGLLSHDPHFALLREEVSFGPSRKRKQSLELQNFFLLHLSLFREYLDLEFQEVRATIPFEYSLERIIDDFILLNIFVGNDFLPHLPGLHINEGAIDALFRIYVRILPRAGGYINEDGVLRTDRLALVLEELSLFEKEVFEEQFGDAAWAKQKAKKANKQKGKTIAAAKVSTSMTAHQKLTYEKVKGFVTKQRKSPAEGSKEMFLDRIAKPNDRQFLLQLAADLGLEVSFDEYNPETDAPAVLIGRRTLLNGDADSDDDEVDSEAWAAVDRVLKKYDQFKLEGSAEDTGEDTEEDEEEAAERKLQEQMTKWKKTYYKEKLNISYDDPEEMRQITFRYVEGLQWVLHYYYDGVASWGWFYDYHYAPMISDLKDVGSMKFEFELGKPFRPFDQLMGVLPSLSCQHIPEAFRDLMTNPASPIADFYPTNFEADYNGKKQSWEAVVKIPFIDEKRLLAALDSRQGLLSSDEKKRNGFGICVRVKYDENVDELYSSSLPGTFPDIVHSKAKLSEFVLPTLDGLHLVKGLLNGVGLGVKALAGFPSIKTLPHYGRLGFHGVNVFQSDSRQQSIVINVENTFEDSKTEDVAEAYIGNRTFIGWPFLREGIVTAVSDEMFKYEARIAKDRTRRIDKNPHEPWEIGEWKRKSAQIEQRYSKRFGVLIGDVNIVLHVRPMLGLKRMDDGSFLKEYETDPKKELEQAIQVSVASVINEDNRFVERPPLPLPLEFPERSKVFYLGGQAYGSPASIIAISSKQIAIELLLLGDQAKENEFLKSMMARRVPDKYYPSHVVSKRLGISGLALSKMTSSMMLDTDDKRINAGLNLKFEAKGQKVLGYSRRGANGWEYSEKAVRLLADLNGQFPEIAQAVMNNPNKDIRHAKDIFGDRSSARIEQLKVWIKESGVRELEAVPLFAEELDSQTIRLLEQVTGQIAETNRKRARRVMLRGVPRNALLKPAHAPYRLTAQHFALGDRVVYVSNTGNVPLASRGVVVGIQSNFLDLVCDAPFLAGTTLDGRCSAYRGATVAFASVLNLSNMQFVCAQGAAETAEATMATAQTSSGVNLGGKASTGSVHGSALQRTLEASKSAKTATDSAKINGNGSTSAQQQQQSYRPPSFFKAARPQGANVGTRGAGLRALGNHKAHAANVDSQVPFAGVASGKSRPRPQSNTADALNPLMAALNMGNGAQGRQAGAPPSSGGRGGAHQQAGRGRPARGRGRGGAAGQTSS